MIFLFAGAVVIHRTEQATVCFAALGVAKRTRQNPVELDGGQEGPIAFDGRCHGIGNMGQGAEFRRCRQVRVGEPVVDTDLGVGGYGQDA